jgi:hypothetical protein
MTYGGGKPNFLNFITPIGVFAHMNHETPLLKTQENSRAPIIDPATGIQEAEWKVTVMWPKAEMNTGLIPLRQMAARCRDEGWPEDIAKYAAQAAGQQVFVIPLQPFLRDGDNPEHNTKGREYLFGHVYLNFKQKAIPRLRDPAGPKQGNNIIWEGGPQIIGPANEDMLAVDIYSGCKGRVSGVMFASEYSGKRYISVRLNNIQRADYQQYERIGGGGRPDAKTQFDPLVQAGGGLGGLGGLGSLGGAGPTMI